LLKSLSLSHFKNLSKRDYIFYLSLLGAILLTVLGIFFWMGFGSQRIVGVQLVTSRGTAIVGRNKYNKHLSVWLSPQIGWFDKKGKPNFFYVKHKKDKASQKGWEIVWEWDELYQNGLREPLIKFVPLQEEKDASIETLTSLCGNKQEASLSCQWNITNRIYIEALTKDYMCISDLASEFYGGAHPIALRRFGSYDVQKRKFVRFDDFISDGNVKEQLWSQLHNNIKAVLDQSLFSSESNGMPAGGVDSLTAPEGQSDSNNANASPEQRLTELLSSQGYTFSPNVFCPIVRPEGPFLLFGFPHSEQVNRGLNFKAEALLNQPKLPKKVLRLFSDYRFTKADKDESTRMLSPDSSWQLSQKLNEIIVKSSKKKVVLTLPEPEESSEELLGIFWIYQSPSIAKLEKFKFKEIKLAKTSNQIDLNKYVSGHS
jgi:hypothetical protein